MGLWTDMMKVMKSGLFANTLKEGNYEVDKARKDGEGRTIDQTYATVSDVESGKVVAGNAKKANNAINVNTVAIQSMGDLQSLANNAQSCPITIHGASNIVIDGVTIPPYSKGWITASTSEDATIMLVDTNGVIYSAYRESKSWGNVRRTSRATLADRALYLSLNHNIEFEDNAVTVPANEVGVYLVMAFLNQDSRTYHYTEVFYIDEASQKTNHYTEGQYVSYMGLGGGKGAFNLEMDKVSGFTRIVKIA